ncbi:hypothetical protein F4780DRAFT_766578 [Xylariomycetidae sp. FL0641]|nr:hypothetical protein F4780DRAFT_766578 [Xylariomycetidae sp. FL0641]
MAPGLSADNSRGPVYSSTSSLVHHQEERIFKEIIHCTHTHVPAYSDNSNWSLEPDKNICRRRTATMLRWYQRKLASRPLLTQSVTTAVLFAVGDITAQQVVEKKGIQKHEMARTGRMFLYGGAVFGPAATTWFGVLQRHVVLRNKNAEILARVACDQLLFAPTMIGVFLSSMATLEGSSVREKLQRSYIPALSTNYLVWPFVQGANFKLVPLHHRVLVVNLVSIGWNCYLSMVNNGDPEVKEVQPIHN